MTIDEVLDGIAELCGFKRLPPTSEPGWVMDADEAANAECDSRGATVGLASWFWYDHKQQHPIPLSIDFLVKLWAERLPGWWERDKRRKVWRYGKVGSDAWLGCIPDTGNIPEDFARLTLAAMEKEANP